MLKNIHVTSKLFKCLRISMCSSDIFSHLRDLNFEFFFICMHMHKVKSSYLCPKEDVITHQSLHKFKWLHPPEISSTREIPSLPDGLRCSWCNDNRNKVHNKCNGLESSQNHPPTPHSMEKLSSTKSVSGIKKVGTTATQIGTGLRS